MSIPEINENLISINTIVSCLSFKAENHDTNIVNFLNNLVITDLNTLKQNHIQYSALCNPKGRIIATFWIDIINPSEVYIFCAHNMQEILTQFFNARKFRLKINIKPSSKSLAINLHLNTLQIMDDTETSKSPASTEDFYLFMMNQQLPWIDNDNSEKFIPQHVNLDLYDKVMSFTKGCYPGQEIIARIKYLGKIKKRMIHIKANAKKSLLQQIQDLELVSPIIHNDLDNSYNIQVIKNNF